MDEKSIKFEETVKDLIKILDRDKLKILNKKISEELMKKKLQSFLFIDAINENTPSSIAELSKIEQIAICKGINKFKAEGFKLSDFFTTNELHEYETYTVIEETDYTLVFDNVNKYNDEYYCCTCWRPSQQFEARKNKLVRYNFDTQREATFNKNAYGSIRKEITLNRNSVEGIKNTMKKGEYFPPDTLTLNVLLLEDKEPNIKYDEESKKLYITINYNIDDYNYTVVDFADGWHRDTAVWELYKSGENVEDYFKGFPVNISITTSDQAAKFVHRQMLANQESKTYLAAVEDNEFNEFINRINETAKDNILFNQIAKTREEMFATGKLTYNEILMKALKHINRVENIDFASRSVKIFGTKKYIEIINTINEELMTYKKENKINDDEYRYFTTEGIYFGYFAVWLYLQNNKLDEDEEYILINNFVKNMMDIKEDIKELKLDNKNFTIKKTLETFKSLI
ncbi:MAG: hypothetical protein ACRC1T_05680 [Clostridium chrysemydis]|uniref:hypothetical protein n=1 Tax=Clostridium chrysemydis TaxID=2665504 RepID=UPI003F410F03